MCKTEQNLNETALLRKMVDGLKQEVEKVGSAELGRSGDVPRHIQKLALQDDPQPSHPLFQA